MKTGKAKKDPAARAFEMELLEHANTSYEKQYDDLLDAWKGLEGKAQNVTTVSGIFLAASFAWARDIPHSFGIWQRDILTFLLALLVISVVLALIGLRIRSVPRAPHSGGIQNMVKDMLELTHAAGRDILKKNFSYDQMRLWKETVDGLETANERKASYILTAQLTLVTAAVVSALLTGAAVLHIYF